MSLKLFLLEKTGRDPQALHGPAGPVIVALNNRLVIVN